MPAEVEFELVIPPELGDHDEVVAAVRDGVECVETAMAQERARTGRRVLGRRAVLDQSWKAAPSSKEPRRNLRPRFAGAKDVLVVAIGRFREFLAAYRAARKLWLKGKRVTFPAGTYWLARFTPVTLRPEAVT